MANEFEQDLVSAGIEFERAPSASMEGEGMGTEEPLAQFGVHRQAFKAALRINHLLHGRHRAPFIPHSGLRWAMLLFTALMIGLGLMGWMQS